MIRYHLDGDVIRDAQGNYVCELIASDPDHLNPMLDQLNAVAEARDLLREIDSHLNTGDLPSAVFDRLDAFLAGTLP